MHDRGNSLSLVRGFQLPAYVRPQNAGNYGVYTMFPETSRDGSPSLPGAVVGERKWLDDDCTISVDHGCFVLSLGNVDPNDVHSIGSSRVQITDIPRAAEGHNLLRD